MSSTALPSRQRRPLQSANSSTCSAPCPGDMAPRDSQDLMAFRSSRWQVRRVAHRLPRGQRDDPRGRHAGARHRHDLGCRHLIWAASQIVEARTRALRPSRLMRATPYEILRFIGRGVAARLPAPQGRAGSACNRPPWPRPSARTTGRRLHRFSWINEWKELADASGAPLGIELILPDWFYAGVLDAALVLTIDPGVFPADRRHRALAVPPGAQARRQAGRRLAIRLSLPAPSRQRCREALRLRRRPARALVARQSLPGYVLGIERMPDDGMELLTFRPVPQTARG